MKNLITFLLYCLSITAMIGQVKSQSSVQVESESLAKTTLRLALAGYDQQEVLTSRGKASVISIEHGTPMLQEGMPDLPKITASLLIPADGSSEIRVLESEYQDFPNILVAPSKGNLMRTVDPSAVPFSFASVYEHDAFYPEKLVDSQDPFVFRDVRGQSIWLYPVQYNPVQRTLRVYTKIVLEVVQKSGTGINELRHTPNAQTPVAFRDLYKKLFLNYKEEYLGPQRSGNEPDKMLVIAKEELIPGLETYLRWKRQSGIYTTVKSISEIGVSDPASLYNFVRNYYTENGISYLLLVGDENALQPMMRPGSNFSCDNCLGYMEGNDHFPEIFVGRFHAANQEQLQIMVNRNLDYELTPLVDASANWCATGMASCSDQGQGIGDDNQADYDQGNEWKSKHLQDGYEKYWEFYDGDQSAISPTKGDETADKPSSPVNTELVNLMNERGVSLYNYTGHGWEQGLASGNFSTDAVANLRNNHRYPLVIAVACCAGNFTNNDGGDCLGEALQRAGDLASGTPYGGIGGLFSSDFQSWSPPMEGQDGMNQYLVDADGINLHPVLGAMASFGNASMIAAYGQAGIDMADVWNPFFDPTTVPRSALPKPMTASHSNEFVIGSTNFVVNSDVEGAQVALYQNGQTIAVAFVNGGVANLVFPALTDVAEMTLTLTQFNYIPYQSKLKAASITGPYVVQQFLGINDSQFGNGNFVAEYGEKLVFDLQLFNAGGALANATAAKLSTTDDQVVITDDSAYFGDIAAGDAPTQEAAFAFQVNDYVEDGHKVLFNLTIQYGNGQTLTIPTSITLRAPKLSVGNILLSDALGGDGDKKFESGETITVTIRNFNTGGSKSQDAIGILSTNSPWLTIQDVYQLGPLNALNGALDAVFSVKIADNAPQVVQFNFNYVVTAGKYDADATSGNYLINPIIEGFESHNFSNYPWVMAGNKPWVITAGNTYSGGYCSRSGTISHNQQSVMTLKLDFSKDGDVSFARKTSSEEGFDFLIFYIDGVEQGKWSGNLEWELLSFPITAGIHEMSWVYKKDEIGSAGYDRVWVDDVSFPPYQVVVATQTPNQPDIQASLMPNPAGGRFTNLLLQLPEALDAQMTLYDGLGRIARSYFRDQPLLQGKYQVSLDIAGLEPGMYYFELRTSNTRKMIKLVITR